VTATAAVPAAFDRPLPSDVGAEQIVLGGMLLAEFAIAEVGEVLRSQDFHRPAHQMIFAAICHLRDRGLPTDPVAVADELAKRGEISRTGGGDYLHDLIAAVPSAANAGFYARIVRDRAVLRRLVEAGTRIVQFGYAQGAVADEALELAAAELDLVAGLTQVAPLESSASLLYRTLDLLGKAADPGLTTGWPDLDDVFRIYKGQMIVVAGRTSMGKSLISLSIAEHIGTDLKEPVLYCSLEMAAVSMMKRRIAARARVDYGRLVKHTLEDADWKRIDEVRHKLQDSRLVIDENPLVSLAQVRAQVRAMARTGNKPKAVVIDLMDLMQDTGKAENRRIAIDGLSRGLKLIAREFDIAVIAVVQLNRGPDLRADHTPVLADLRDSGGIEANADAVLLLYRPDYYDKESPQAGELEVHIGKQRDGQTCVVTLAFRPHYQRADSLGPR